MKSLFLLSALFFSVTAFSNNSSDGSKSSKLQAAKSEMKNLFNASKPANKGTVIALIEFDDSGKGTIKEINSSDDSLRLLVVKKISSKTFRNIKNETIRLAVDFRK